MKNTLLSICLLVFLISCGSISSSSDRFKNVDVADVVKETDISSISTSNCKTIRMSKDDEHILKTSDLFDSVEYIPLSNDPNAIIGGISKLIVFDYSYFILDRWTSSVKRFGLDGSYIATIGNRGQGPKEYLSATDFVIQDSMVLLYDAHQDKINYYDLNGNYVKTKKIKFLFDFFSTINSDYLCLHRIYENPHIPSIKDYNMLIVDTSFNIIHKAIYNKDLRAYLHNPFRTNKRDKNVIYYNRTNSDSIYSINDRCEIKAEYKFIFDKPSLPLSYQSQKVTTEELNKVTFGDEYATPINYIMADDYVFLEYICKRDWTYMNFFSKNTGKNKYFCTDGMRRAILNKVLCDNAPFGIGDFLIADGNKMIGFVQTSLIKSDIMGRELDPKFQKMLDNMSEDDNPWLVISHIKDF